MSSILVERRGAFVAGTASSLFHFAHLDLGYFGYVPTTTNVWPDLPSLQYIISLNIFGFCSVAFLSNFLAESWRRTGVELEKSTGQIAFLQGRARASVRARARPPSTRCNRRSAARGEAR